jgi:hypothetical protein
MIAMGASTTKNTRPIIIGFAIWKSSSDHRQPRLSGPGNGAANQATMQNINAATNQTALRRPSQRPNIAINPHTAAKRRPKDRSVEPRGGVLGAERLVPTSVGRSHSLLAEREINSISLITAKINPELIGCTAVYAAHIPASRPPQRCGWTRRSGSGKIAFGGDWVRTCKSHREWRPIEPLISA